MLIDLTRTISEEIPDVSLETFRTVAKDGWNAKMLHLYSHCGTHMDAPWHFECGESSIDQTPLETCTGMAHIVRLPETTASELLTVNHLGALATSFPSGHHLLLNTNWSHRFGQPDYKSGLPRISAELAQWCVASGVKILGVEPASVADVANLEEVTAIHRILLGGGVTIVEGLVNLDQVPVDHCFFAALPLKIQQGDGSPCRAFASTTPLGFA
jgi:kynurenine formamidase